MARVIRRACTLAGIGTCALLLACAPHADERSEGMQSWIDFGGLLVMADALHKSQAICARLFPSQTTVFRGFYESSSVPAYAKAIGLELPPSPDDREEALKSLGKSESEVSSWCMEKFPESLAQFDELYAKRLQEYAPALEKMRDERLEQNYPSAAPVKPTAELTGLFAKIVERSNQAYQTGDWSVFANLYEPGTFDCWRGVPGADQFAFLSFPPLSAHATFKVSEYTEYLWSDDPFSFSRVEPTHLVEYSDAISRPGDRCGLEKRELWPGGYFFLVKRGTEFHLTHFCPSKRAVDAGELGGHPLTAAQTSANIARVSAADWDAIASAIRQDRYSDRPHQLLNKHYGFDEQEANEVIFHVCDPANKP